MKIITPPPPPPPTPSHTHIHTHTHAHNTFSVQVLNVLRPFQGEDHPIVPVMLEDARLATEFADDMLEKGIYVIGFSFPVVPKGIQRLVLAPDPNQPQHGSLPVSHA